MALRDLFKPQVAGLLENFELDQAPAENTETTLLKLEGTKAGFIPWLAKKLGSKSQNMAISMTDKTITVQEGKTLSMYPTSEVLDFKVGYGKDKKMLILVIIGLIYCIIPGVIIYFLVYKKSDGLTLEFNFPMHQSAMSVFKNKKVGGTIKLDESVVNTTMEKVKEVVYNNSRYYQKVNLVNPSDI